MTRASFRVATSMTATDPARPSDTYSCLPSGEITAPMGLGGAGAPEAAAGLPEAAAGGPAAPPEGLAPARGVVLGPAGAIWIVLVGLCVAASITVTAPPFSFVENPTAPSFVNAMARGRAAVLMCASTFNVVVSMATTSLSPSQLTYTSRPPGRTVTPSGSSPTFT